MMSWELLVLCMGVLISVLVLSVDGKHNTIIGKGCPQGCSSCSPYNGCINCNPQYYLLLYRSGMKHVGICTHGCPSSYYASSNHEINRCLKCRVDNCDLCFGRSFCAKCMPGYYTHRGKCYDKCPEGMYEEKHTGDCKPIIDCEVGEWNDWGLCMRDGQTCGRKWGEKVRTRDVLTMPARVGMPCPELIEIQKCKISPRFCPEIEPTESPDKGNEGSKRKKKKRRQRGRRKRKRKGGKKDGGTARERTGDGTARERTGDGTRPVTSSRRNKKQKSRDRTTSTLIL